MKLFFSLTSLLILTFSSFGNGEWLYYKYYPWVWDNMTKDWLYLRGSSDGKIYSYRASTQEWEEFSVSTSSSTSVAVSENEESFYPNNPSSSLTVDLNSSVSLDMIWVEPGTFTMGQSDITIASPVHEVTLTQGFYLGKYEVTQAQYEAVMTGNTDRLNAKPSNSPNNPNRPVERVSHDYIQKFLTRLNSQQSGNIPEGWAYVLPTEAQWEYACRAGTTTAYSWGDDINSSRANYNWDGGSTTDNDFKQTRDVGMYDANPWGFFDMHGNVWEWTADWYAAYNSGSQTDPEGAPAGSFRVIRGGSWGAGGANLRSAERGYVAPSFLGNYFGFRVSLQESQ